MKELLKALVQVLVSLCALLLGVLALVAVVYWIVVKGVLISNGWLLEEQRWNVTIVICIGMVMGVAVGYLGRYNDERKAKRRVTSER